MSVNQFLPYQFNQNNLFNSILYLNLPNFSLRNVNFENENNSSPILSEKNQNEIQNYLSKDLLQMINMEQNSPLKDYSINLNIENYSNNLINNLYGKKLNFFTKEKQNENNLQITNSYKNNFINNSNKFIRNSQLNNNMGNQFGNNKRKDINNDFILQKKINYNNKKGNIKKNKKKKDFIERIGDWCCYKCKNLNFSFRDYCNRCELSKEISEEMYKTMEEKLIKFIENEYLNVSTSDSLSNKSNQ